MHYLSTRNPEHRVLLSEAIAQGIAPDGGLFVPESFPHLLPHQFDGLTTLPEIGARLIQSAQEPVVPGVRVGVADVQIPAPLTGERHQLAAVGGLDHHRLLDHHVSAGQERVPDQLVVGVMGGGNHHPVRLEVEQLPMIAERLSGAELPGREPRLLEVRVRDAN